MENLVICGDSFNYGIGCSDLATQPFGVLVANHFNLNLIRLARGSASNYAIHLQGEFAAVNLKPKLVILGTTSTDRFEWVAEGKKLEGTPTLYDLCYHNYPPHHLPQPMHDAPMDFYLNDTSHRTQYSPKILTEQIPAIFEYRQVKKNEGSYGYYTRLHTEPLDKLELIERYYLETFDSYIKADYDRAVILKAYRKLKQNNIPTIIYSEDMGFKDYVDDERDYFWSNWKYYSDNWPDKFGSKHVSEEGNYHIANRLIDYITKNDFLK
jgi:hypothetical protein